MGTADPSTAQQGGAGKSRADQDDPRTKMRRHDRKAVVSTVMMHEIESDGTVSAGIEGRGFDFSRSGMGLDVKRLLHPGKVLLIRLKVSGKPDTLAYGIVRNVNYKDGVCKTGVEFTPAPDSASLKRWLADNNLK